MQLKPIEQQVVVVFGASSGIGRLTARQFAARGARVVATARSEPGLQSLVDEIQQQGGEAVALPAEVTDFAQVAAVANQAAEQYGRIDTWVHLAAVSVYARFDEMTPEEFKRVIDVNLTGQAYGAMAALPHLKREGRGALIHVSSVLGRRAVPLQSAYCASKHGMEGFLDALRVELMQASIPISVTNILPASINTPFFTKAQTRLGVQPAPYPPVYQPHLVAEAIVHAAQYPTREIMVGEAARILAISQCVSPSLVDSWLTLTGSSLQQTDIPKAADAPNNLFAPMQGQDRIEGDFGSQAQSYSWSTWLEMQQSMWSALSTDALENAGRLFITLLGTARHESKPGEQ